MMWYCSRVICCVVQVFKSVSKCIVVLNYIVNATSVANVCSVVLTIVVVARILFVAMIVYIVKGMSDMVMLRIVTLNYARSAQ